MYLKDTVGLGSLTQQEAKWQPPVMRFVDCVYPRCTARHRRRIAYEN
jgi:hypothetical protein